MIQSQKSLDAWNELNPRQQTYLRLIYQVDQEAEQESASRWRSGQRRRSADEWRWQLYADTSAGPTRLKRLLCDCYLVDPGTGSTFEALETRGLIQCRHEFDKDYVWIRLTTHANSVILKPH